MLTAKVADFSYLFSFYISKRIYSCDKKNLKMVVAKKVVASPSAPSSPKCNQCRWYTVTAQWSVHVIIVFKLQLKMYTYCNSFFLLKRMT